jgi:hypothetical protein
MPTRVCNETGALSAFTAAISPNPAPYSPLCIIFMGFRIAEIHEHAIAHILGNEAAEASNGLSDAFLIGGNDFTQILGVHARGQRRRTDQVREHDCDLSALCGLLRFWLRQCGLR